MAGMAGADGRGVQDSDLRKGNELMKPHLGGKRGIQMSLHQGRWLLCAAETPRFFGQDHQLRAISGCN